MRSLPVGWAVPIDRPDQRRAWTIELARATHPGAEACCAACIGSACAAWSIEGADAALLLEIAASEARVAAEQCRADARIAEMIASVSRGSWRPDPKANVLDPYETLTRALWCLTEASSAADRMLAAVRIGGDTDTVAALVGGLSGAGSSPAAVRTGIPWITGVQLPAAADITRLAAALAGLRVAASDG